jgi:hypothetical protein
VPPGSGSAVASPRRSRGGRIVRWLLVLVLLGTAVALATGATALAVLGYGPGQAMRALAERSPVEMIGQAFKRLEGHPRLESVLHPALRWLHRQWVREPGGILRDLGKGVRPHGLSPQRYDERGAPLPSLPAMPGVRPPVATRLLSTAADIAAAVGSARPGDVLEIVPGSYALPGTLRTRIGGRSEAPIVLRAAKAGTVTLEVRSVEGVVVSHPYWVFENLEWVGRCPADDDCEHAFHIVADARATVVRNQRMVDFSAHLKINGQGGQYPDSGLLQFSSLVNTRPRVGQAPVTLVDLVAASGWQLLDNHLEGFVKRGSNGVSYGMFMKGGGRGGRIERNVVVCTPSSVGQPGLRLGISLGGGTTGADACRDKRCDFEFEGALVANNVVAHCNDAGIDVNKSRKVRIAHNTLVNTQGVLLRSPPSEAEVLNNVMDARVRHRDGAALVAEQGNLIDGLSRRLLSADTLDLRWRELAQPTAVLPDVPLDFCGRRRGGLTEPGAGAAAPCSGSLLQ